MLYKGASVEVADICPYPSLLLFVNPVVVTFYFYLSPFVLEV